MAEQHASDDVAPEPELSLAGSLDIRGVGKVGGSGRARAAPAIMALRNVMIAVTVMAGAVAIVWIVVHAYRNARCTVHIDRTRDTEHIDRTCTRDG